MGFANELEQFREERRQQSKINRLKREVQLAERKAYKAPSLAETYAVNPKWPLACNPHIWP